MFIDSEIDQTFCVDERAVTLVSNDLCAVEVIMLLFS